MLGTCNMGKTLIFELIWIFLSCIKIELVFKKALNLHLAVKHLYFLDSPVAQHKKVSFDKSSFLHLTRAWRWHVTVGGDSHREILIFCHRHRHRHRRRKKYSPSLSPSPPGKKISPSPSPPNKKIFTVTVTVKYVFYHHDYSEKYFIEFTNLNAIHWVNGPNIGSTDFNDDKNDFGIRIVYIFRHTIFAEERSWSTFFIAALSAL